MFILLLLLLFKKYVIEFKKNPKKRKVNIMSIENKKAKV